MRRILTGSYPEKDINMAQKEAKIQLGIVNSVLSAFAVASKNKRAMSSLNKMNILDSSTAVDLMLGNPEEDKIKCPIKDDLITREECLDYSGSNGNECNGCKTGIRTKEILLNI